MYGYVFLTENLTNNKRFVGVHRAVVYDRKFLGDNPDLLADIQKQGTGKFTTKMLMPYESEKALVAGEEYWLNEYKDSNLYNGGKSAKTEVDTEDKPKKSRKKKSEDD